MRLQKYLNEKLIVIGNGEKYGQIVFLAGGGASGKGFVTSNFMEKEKFKVRDVDEWKRLFIKMDDIKKNHPEVRGLDLRNPDDVFKFHQIIVDKGIKDKTLDLLLTDLKRGRLPNILFDITLKWTKDLTNILPKLLEVGYDKKNIHLVWVLANYQISVQRNHSRSRIVPDDVMLMAHSGVAVTVTDMLRGKNQIIGTMLDGEINVVLNNEENTIYMTTLDTRDTLKNKTQMGGDKIKPKGDFIPPKPEDGIEVDHSQFVIKDFKYINIKERGKPVKTDANLKKQLHKWIVDNIPKTKSTRNIFRRKTF
jgi:dephospho-CoA kinase